MLDREELKTDAAQKAARLVKAGQTARAVEVLESGLDAAPRSARLHLELAIILHESEKDYLGAAYHYRKYIALRPDSQKRHLIEDRMRLAQRLLTADVQGTQNMAGIDIEVLEQENSSLKSSNRELERELNQTRADARRYAAVASRPDLLSDTDASSLVTHDGGFTRYRVARGDSLSSIALKVYKDASRSDEIFEANKRALRDPNNLMIGQVLIIP